MAKLLNRSVVLVDIDHTISNAFWRDAMIGTVEWDEYHAGFKDDKPLADMVSILRTLEHYLTIVGITARPEKWRQQTMKWLIYHSVPMDELLMRPDDAYHPAAEIKVKLATERFGELLADVLVVIDDREDVVNAFKEKGVTAMQVFARKS